MHFTQTCAEDAPQLITHDEATPAPISDEGILCAVNTSQAEMDLLPEQHLVDAGYIGVSNLVKAQSGDGVDLVSPALKTQRYQTETGYDLTHFSIDWEAETVISPEGQDSSDKPCKL